MIMSALIAECRREYQDPVRSSIAAKAGDGTTTLFNLGRYPIIESSYSVKKGTSAMVDLTDYSLNLDNGDLQFIISAPPNGIQAQAFFKYANWRDQQWLEALNQGIDTLNGKGFFRQSVREQFAISAKVRQYSAPSGTIEVYELLESDNGTISGNMRKPAVNWSYQQDQNQIVFGQLPSSSNKAWISRLRNMNIYGATSATVDVKFDWKEMLKKYAGAVYSRSMAQKVATQGNANIDEGHFSFTSLRTQSNDLFNDFNNLAKAKKPTRPAVDIQQKMDTGGYGG